MLKICKDNEILNPKTNRCILKNSKIGIEILKEQERNKSKNECIQWLMKRLEDPITKKKIAENGSIYEHYLKKYFLKECNLKNEKKIKGKNISVIMESLEPLEPLEPLKSITPKPKATKGKAVKEVKEVKEPKATKEVKEVKEVKGKVKEPKATKEVKEVKRKELKEVKEVKGKVKEPVIKIAKDACIEKKGDELIIGDIKLIKQFGTKSVFGINYISSLINNPDFKFSSKIQFKTKEALKELGILKIINDYRIKNNNIHLPVMYDFATCPKVTNAENLPDFFKVKSRSKSYITILNELYSGDLKTFINEYANNNYDIWLNLIEQIYMSIATLHSMGLMHHDSHWGNFLFKKIEAGGYFHYKINGEDYYIPNIGYLWIIWDFGVSGRIYRHFDYHTDYNLLTLFLRYNNDKLVTKDYKIKFNLEDKDKSYRPWGNVSDDVLIPKKLEDVVKYLWEFSGKDKLGYSTELNKNNLTEDKWINKISKDGILFTYKPKSNEKMINSTTINFQNITKEFSFLIDKKAYPYDLEFIK